MVSKSTVKPDSATAIYDKVLFRRQKTNIGLVEMMDETQSGGDYFQHGDELRDWNNFHEGCPPKLPKKLFAQSMQQYRAISSLACTAPVL